MKHVTIGTSFSRAVRNWYQFVTRCEELVPIFQGVKFAKCEICGSTKVSIMLNGLKNYIYLKLKEFPQFKMGWVYLYMYMIC